jgi:hypothetical protein
MAEDGVDRERELEEEREAEIASELRRVGEDPDEVGEGEESLGTQNAPTGEVREGTEGGDEDERLLADEDDEIEIGEE